MGEDIFLLGPGRLNTKVAFWTTHAITTTTTLNLLFIISLEKGSKKILIIFMEFSMGGVPPIRQNNKFCEKNIVVGKKTWKLFKMVWNMKKTIKFV